MPHKVFIILLILLSSSTWAESPPRVVTSIAPIHSLVASIMKGVSEPELLIKGGASPHDYQLRPSQMRALSRAQVIFWIGEQNETFLQRPLATAKPEQQVVELIKLPHLTLLPTRQGDNWEKAHEHKEHAHDHHEEEFDSHIWLDPENAKVMARAIAKTLSQADPEHAQEYTENADQLILHLTNLHIEIETLVIQALNKPYLVFHDAYQYFEHRYGLKAVGSVAISPDRRPGAKRLKEIRRKLKEAEAHCLFSEPQFPTSRLEAILGKGEFHTGHLDPLGIDIPPGPDMYFTLLRRLANDLVSCLHQVEAH